MPARFRRHFEFLEAGALSGYSEDVLRRAGVALDDLQSPLSQTHRRATYRASLAISCWAEGPRNGDSHPLQRQFALSVDRGSVDQLLLRATPSFRHREGVDGNDVRHSGHRLSNKVIVGDEAFGLSARTLQHRPTGCPSLAAGEIDAHDLRLWDRASLKEFCNQRLFAGANGPLANLRRPRRGRNSAIDLLSLPSALDTCVASRS